MPEIFGTLACIAYVAATLAAAFRPTPALRVAERSALERGWSMPVIRFTRSTQYFTNYAKGWLIYAIFSGSERASCIALALGTTVAVLYYGLLMFDRALIVHPENMDIARRLLGPLPPPDLVLGFTWIGLHFQHIACPSYLWIRGGFQCTATSVSDSIIVVLVYIAWNHACWKVQGAPAYPAQSIADRAGLYLPAMAGCIALVGASAALSCNL
jgi:hypothetical protein